MYSFTVCFGFYASGQELLPGLTKMTPFSVLIEENKEDIARNANIGEANSEDIEERRVDRRTGPV
jgi:hypothetical protein